jgi:protein O-mannosyl-transferase
MRRELLFVFFAAVLLYLPTVRYGYVQDDRAIIVSNPAAHSVGAALGAFDDPYWPRESGAGLYRPVTILTFAIDWTLSGGRAGWFHVVNALWHGLVTVLLVMVLVRWLPLLAAAAAGLVFAWHPVHVEAVASIVGRAELLAAAGILGGVLAARRGWWAAAVVLAALAMFSKEHGVIAGVVILIDKWLQPESPPSPEGGGGQGVGTPVGLWVGLGVVTAAYIVIWGMVGVAGASAPAAIFYGRDTWARLAIALPVVLRAAVLLVWPLSLSSDYSPQVIPAYDGLSFAAVLGFLVVVAIPALIIVCRRRAPAISFTAALAALSFVPTSNLLFAGGVVLAERNLYLAVALPAAIVGTGFAWLMGQRGARPAFALSGALAIASAAIAISRLPSWSDNRTQLLTLLAEHPESYTGHASAAAVLAGRGDTAGARQQYRIADSLFQDDPYLDAAHAIFLLSVGDTTAARPLIARLSTRTETPAIRMSLRAQFLFDLRRGDLAAARAALDSALERFPGDESWYRQYLQ